MAFSFFCCLMESFLSAYVCRCSFVEGRPVGVVKFGVVNGCREVLVVIPWGSGPGIDVRFLFESFDCKRGLGNCVDGG